MFWSSTPVEPVRRRGQRLAGAAAGMAAAAVLLAACGGGGGQRAGSSRGSDGEAVVDYGYPVGGGSIAPRQEGYIAAYSEGRYAAAKSLAEAEMRRTEGVSKERATLIAGLSAHALDQDVEAERLLGPLASSEDREVAGRAEAGLGLIARSRRQHDRAAGLLASAARKLSGDDGARAAMFAGDSYMTLSRQGEAKSQYALAGSKAVSPALKRSIADRVEVGNFTVQIGVFNQRVNAQRAATEVAPAAAMLGLGEPLITERREAAGGTSYVVQVGRFTTRRQATEAQTRLGSGWLVSLAAGE